MSADKRLDAAFNHTQASRAANAAPHVDINSLIQQCPAHQPHIFVVPVRYALSEKPVSHPVFQPGVETKSRPMAARLLRPGFVYVWQGKGPLQRYAVAENGLLRQQSLDDDDTIVSVGNLTGMALDKLREAWMLYTEIPINAMHCEQLSEPKVRAKRMRRLDLLCVANTLQAPHCAPLTGAKQVMGELIPESYERALALDYRHNGAAYQEGERQLGQQLLADTRSPTLPIKIKAYTDARRWNEERSAVAARNSDIKADSPPMGEWSAAPWAPLRVQEVMELAHTQAQGQYSVLACLDDDLGVLRDINYEQELIECRHEQWQADNNVRLSIGGFVRSLITQDADDVIAALSYRYREHQIELTREQAQQVLNARSRLEALARERYTANIRRGTTHSNNEADVRLHEIHLREQAAVAPLRAFIPLKLHDDVLNVVRDYQESKVNNLRNTHASSKVEEYIDLPAMNQWLDETAPAHFAHLQQRHATLYADRGLYLLRHGSGTWCVDYRDPDHRQWLDRLAMACLSGQCLRKVGSEQYADYVRSADDGALRQLFTAWSPTLEGALNSATRAGELVTALGNENQANAMLALAKVLGTQGLDILSDLSALASDVTGLWSTLVKRLGASLLLLNTKVGDPLKGPWLTIMIAARAGNHIGVRQVQQGGRRVFQAFGKAAEDLNQWVNTTGKAIGAGRVADIVNSPAVKGSGGLVALVVLLLNTWNASHYLAQADVMERMDKQRQNDTLSATLYAGAALVAVIDSQVRYKAADRAFTVMFPTIGRATFPAMTIFGTFIGLLSAFAAFKEYGSLQKQIENSHDSLDPWLDRRHSVVGGQIAVFGALALVGAYYTVGVLFGAITSEAALAGFLLWAGPLNILIAALGVIYLVAWYLQQTPMQNFLNYCCWSRARAKELSPISLEAQQKELSRLYTILYAPRVSFVKRTEPKNTSSHMGLLFTSYIDSLTIDLPGAEPGSVYLDITMIGNPRDTLAMRERVKNGEPRLIAQEPMQDIGDVWIHSSSCEWIPADEGQGLRLKGPFKREVANLFASQPTEVSLRLRYRTPLTSMLGALSYIGGERGVAFTLSEISGVVSLRNDSTPELDKTKRYPLGGEQCSIYLQPGIKR